jgi:DNA-damage-inducible protein D
MNSESIFRYSKRFDSITYHEDTAGLPTEFWYARDLQEILGYTKWSEFQKPIKKAVISCESAGLNKEEHFIEVLEDGKLVDYKLTRYACYLIAQNSSPSKEEVAFTQAYFVLQSRRAEQIEERMKQYARLETRERLKTAEQQFSSIMYDHGVLNDGFARVRSKGDKALLGHSTKEMKKRYNVKDNRSLADFLPSIALTAKQLQAEMTSISVQDRDLQGEFLVTSEHIQNGTTLRGALASRGINLGELPPAEDIRSVKSRIARDEKRLQSPGATS